MPQEDRGGPRAAGDRGLDERLVAEAQNKRAREPCDTRPPGDRKGEYHGENTGSHNGREQDRENQLGEGQNDVSGAHGDGIDPAAEIGGRHAHRSAQCQRESQHRGGDPQ